MHYFWVICFIFDRARENFFFYKSNTQIITTRGLIEILIPFQQIVDTQEAQTDKNRDTEWVF